MFISESLNTLCDGEYTTSQKRVGRKIPKRIFTKIKVVKIKRDGFRKRGGKGGGQGNLCSYLNDLRKGNEGGG